MPRSSRKSTAARSPTASAIGGVPASNFAGTGAVVKPSRVTLSIMLPPPRNGGIASSSSMRPHSTPMPDGPHILWPEKATKSAPHACTSVALCGTYWQASTTASAPAAWAAAQSSATGVMRAEHVGHGGEREHLGAVEELVEVGEVELAVGGERHPADLDAALVAQHLPRHDVGVVLHVGEHDDVALAEVGAAPRAGDEVDRLGGVLGEDHLVGARRVDQPGDGTPGALVGLGRLAGESVGAAVDGRVGGLEELGHGVDDLARLLRRVPRVEVHERCAVDLTRQDGELLAHRVEVERHQARQFYPRHEFSLSP